MRDPLKDFLRKKILNRRRRKPSKDCLLALDIGTEFVKALLLKVEDCPLEGKNDQKIGVVIGVGRQRQRAKDMIAGAVADIEGVVETCRQAIKQACQSVKIRPERVVLGVAGEFVKGVTSNFVFTRSSPEQEIDSAELQNIIQKVQWKAFDQMRQSLAWETCRREVEIKPINALLAEVRIDGYRVTNPLGFQGREVFLSIFNVYASLVHLQALEKVAAKLGLELLSVAAESYALAKALNLPSSAGAIFIDIGGGTTDIALVRQGRVEGVKSLSLAGRAFTRRISQVLNLDLAAAEELKTRQVKSQLGQDIWRRLNEILSHDVAVWLAGVELVLEEFQKEEPLPGSILLCGGGSLLPGIRDIFKKESTQKKWQEKFNFSQPFQTSYIKAKDIENIFDMTETLKGAQIITPMALASLALDIAVNEERPLPPILRRVVRMMR